jgi:hypothetical protein
MSHGFSRILAHQSHHYRMLFDNERKKIRANPHESVAKVSA